MTAETAQYVALLIISLLAIVILLRILFIVHHQTRHVKELEMRMKAIEKQAVEPEEVSAQLMNDGKEG
jgi:hypothetical protein